MKICTLICLTLSATAFLSDVAFSAPFGSENRAREQCCYSNKMARVQHNEMSFDDLSENEMARIEGCCYGSMDNGNAVGSYGSNNNNHVYGRYLRARVQQCCGHMGSGNAVNSPHSNTGNTVGTGGQYERAREQCCYSNLIARDQNNEMLLDKLSNVEMARVEGCCYGSMDNGNAVGSYGSNNNNHVYGRYLRARVQQCCGHLGNGNAVESPQSNNGNTVGVGGQYQNARVQKYEDLKQILNSLVEKVFEN